MSKLSKKYRFFLVLYILFFATFYAFAESYPKDSSSQISTESKNNVALKQNTYLQGDIDILSNNAPIIVKDISDKIYKATKIQVMLYVIKETPYSQTNNTESKINQKFQDRRLYETKILDSLKGQYAVIFLFYNDHAITLRSNLDFLDKEVADSLLESYAYPYLPADSVGTLRYDNGVNEGVSNLYLALAHTIANHYNIELNAPKPMEQPDEVTKVVLYAMLLILLGLFILVRFGLLAWKKKG